MMRLLSLMLPELRRYLGFMAAFTYWKVVLPHARKSIQPRTLQYTWIQDSEMFSLFPKQDSI